MLASSKNSIHPAAAHLTICPLANMGFNCCPGCGMGRSIIALLHGNLSLSLKLHWFGIPALMILSYRILVLMRLQLITSRINKLQRKEEEDV
ncbi:DUF2752 domain-containing protein [Pedobacter sp.]|uniref:DUF2752 domain-containing protein n=1 Tax=Pedobacter sp. TaxID=1411316 RepID=UPI003D7F6CB2